MWHNESGCINREGAGKIESRRKARLAAEFAQDKKAEDLVILDMRKAANFCDYFVICSGNSQRQVDAITDIIEESFLKQKIRTISNIPKNGMWDLLDYGDVIIHIFEKESRIYYDLERLWIDAPRISLSKN